MHLQTHQRSRNCQLALCLLRLAVLCNPHYIAGHRRYVLLLPREEAEVITQHFFQKRLACFLPKQQQAELPFPSRPCDWPPGGASLLVATLEWGSSEPRLLSYIACAPHSIRGAVLPTISLEDGATCGWVRSQRGLPRGFWRGSILTLSYLVPCQLWHIHPYAGLDVLFSNTHVLFCLLNFIPKPLVK